MSRLSGIGRRIAMTLGLSFLLAGSAVADVRDRQTERSLPVQNHMKKNSGFSQRGHNYKKRNHTRKINRLARWSRIHT